MDKKGFQEKTLAPTFPIILPSPKPHPKLNKTHWTIQKILDKTQSPVGCHVGTVCDKATRTSGKLVTIQQRCECSFYNLLY